MTTENERREQLRRAQAAKRQREKEAGRVAVTVWIHPDDRERLRAYAARLNSPSRARS